MSEAKPDKAQTDTAKAEPRTVDRTDRQQGRALQGREPWGRFAFSPFDLFERFSDEMDRTFHRVFQDFGFGRESSPARTPFGVPAARDFVWSPRIEAFQKGDRFLVRTELPGMKKDDVQVEVTEDAIVIQGERRSEHKDEREGYYHNELSYGRFHRAIPLPQGTISEGATATFNDGVLEISVPAAPAEANRGRRLEISEGTEGRKK